MKKTIKFISVCMSLVIMCLLLISCGVSKDEIVGTWYYSSDDDAFTLMYDFDESNECIRGTYIGTFLMETETGYYKIEGNKIIVTLNDGKTVISYEYDNGTLVQEGTGAIYLKYEQ